MSYHAGSHNSGKLIEVESFLELLAKFSVDIAHILLLHLHSEGLHDGLKLASINLP